MFCFYDEPCEEKYKQLVNMINAVLERDRALGFKNLCKPLLNEPFIIRFSKYSNGLFKIHKVDYSVRPIVSSMYCMGKPLEKWLLAKLDVIAKQLCKIYESQWCKKISKRIKIILVRRDS